MTSEQTTHPRVPAPPPTDGYFAPRSAPWDQLDAQIRHERTYAHMCPYNAEGRRQNFDPLGCVYCASKQHMTEDCDNARAKARWEEAATQYVEAWDREYKAPAESA